jgi:hypothetical protein
LGEAQRLSSASAVCVRSGSLPIAPYDQAKSEGFERGWSRSGHDSRSVFTLRRPLQWTDESGGRTVRPQPLLAPAPPPRRRGWHGRARGRVERGGVGVVFGSPRCPPPSTGVVTGGGAQKRGTENRHVANQRLRKSTATTSRTSSTSRTERTSRTSGAHSPRWVHDGIPSEEGRVPEVPEVLEVLEVSKVFEIPEGCARHAHAREPT